MANPMVYSGAMTGGSLFDGMKFWVARRIPSRSLHLEMITSNGGQIVPLEKLADVMIADHAVKSAPPGSYSWRFIADSVKKGRLENLEDHPAGPSRDTRRSVGSSRPPKGTRTVFTDEDDRVLAEWVTKAEKQGLQIKGNEIYQQLEAKNPRHTFQSWRDRWIKYGQFQKQAHPMQDNRASGPSPQRLISNRSSQQHSDATRPDRASDSRPLRNMPSYTKPSPKKGIFPTRIGTPPEHNGGSSQVVQSHPKPSSSRRPLMKEHFTEGERDILLGMYDDIMNIDETKLIEAWEAFADVHPQHTTRDWYRFWMEHVKPLGALQREEAMKHKPLDSPPKIQTSRSSPMAQIVKSYQDVEVHNPSTDPPSSHRASLESPYVNEEVFEHYLTEYLKNCAEYQGQRIELETVVSGKKIRLFDLWRIVNRPGFGGSGVLSATRRWGNVAQQLGFKHFNNLVVSSKLESTYDLLLADFSEAMALWTVDPSDWKPMIGEDDVLDEEKLLRHQEEMQRAYTGPLKQMGLRRGESTTASDDNLEFPSSPPQRLGSSGKRSHPPKDIPLEQRETLQIPPATPNKRQKIDKGKGKLVEIPSTPEDLVRSRPPVRGSRLPSAMRDSTLTHNGEDDLRGDEENDMFTSSPERDVFDTSILEKVLKTSNGNPKTQDFRFLYRQDRKASKTMSPDSQDAISVPEDDMGGRESPHHEGKTTESQEDPLGEVRLFVDHHVSLGYPEEIVTQALLATTMETGDVATVMESMMRGDGIPVNIEGVWTEEDDAALGLSRKPKHYQRVLAKHGEERCVQRRQFLSEDILKDIKWDRYRKLARNSASWAK